ncbi:GGDEF domain-containing protein [Marinitoga sp. 1154]|uniref:GGDEF domain-containing protein n=1 Tax=Marinitoga sp. 1154 TaxID=1643335 RepID=UPI001586CFF2|nr:GGDEF domain-containing protein [Marinitoga sp. 1154]
MIYSILLFLLLSIFFIIISKYNLRRTIKNIFIVLNNLPLIIIIYDFDKIYYYSSEIEKILKKKIITVDDYITFFDKKEKLQIIQILSTKKDKVSLNFIKKINNEIYKIFSMKITFFGKIVILQVFHNITEIYKKDKMIHQMNQKIEVLDNLRNLTYTENFNLSGIMESIFNYLRKVDLVDLFAFSIFSKDKKSAKVTIYFENKKIETTIYEKQKGISWYFLKNNLKKLYIQDLSNFSKDEYKSVINIYEMDNSYKDLTLYLFPYKFEKNIHGLFSFGKKGIDSYSEMDKKLIESIAEHIDFVVRYQYILKKYNEENNHYKDLLTKDTLTQLYSRYYFNEWILKHAEYLKRNNKKSILAMIDINNFKNINDTYGHLTGDNVLKFIANIFLNNIRSMDIAVRFGGDEFLLIFPDATIKNIKKKMKIIIEKIKENNYSFDVSISYGLSEFCGESYIESLKRADKKMYEMKKNLGKKF